MAELQASYFKVEMSPHIDQFNSVLHADNYRRWNQPKLFFKEGAWERTSVQQSAQQQQHAADLQMTRA